MMYSSTQHARRATHIVNLNSSLGEEESCSDAEEDKSLLFGMWGIWGGLLSVGVVLGLGGVLGILNGALSYAGALFGGGQVESNSLLQACAFFCLAYPMVTVSGKTVSKLGSGMYVPLKGTCPRCKEEVYSILDSTHDIVRPSKPVNFEQQTVKSSMKSDCHMCSTPLVFESFTKVNVKSNPENRQEVQGRIYVDNDQLSSSD
eukprot:CAMPEP_0196571462 /NCGR_PEP_ID=MMETSP1081-20130531/1643_1 /TAXON_ID=36882 /ORGANISM="Pyramimonas amylifera, Strain CCMP720" /LENGTH=202 /DNA_ID=CAMNT_0041888425 /DNA_START=168 /DNA_END=776 /DNA_ORIENTATION=-